MKKMMPFAVTFILILTACPIIDTVEYGSLILGFSSADMQTRTIVPAISMDISYYDAHGDGPNSATFDQNNLPPGSSIVESSLETGTWTITVDAYNTAPTKIGSGTVVVEILAGQTATESVIVTPLTGTGSLSVALSWPQFTDSLLTVTVTDTQGATHAPDSSFEDHASATSTATYTWDHDTGAGLAAGYYWLNIRLSDLSGVKWGANPSVRIVEGQTTSASFTLTATDLETGMEVQILPQMRNPVPITLTDNNTTLELVSPVSIAEGGSVDIAITDPATAEYYQWYVDGTSVLEGSTATESRLVYGDTLTQGLYRVDVGIETETGLVLSSKTFNIEVTAP